MYSSNIIRIYALLIAIHYELAMTNVQRTFQG